MRTSEKTRFSTLHDILLFFSQLPPCMNAVFVPLRIVSHSSTVSVSNRGSLYLVLSSAIIYPSAREPIFFDLNQNRAGSSHFLKRSDLLFSNIHPQIFCSTIWSTFVNCELTLEFSRLNVSDCSASTNGPDEPFLVLKLCLYFSI